MALWGCLGQAANVTQLGGVDLLGLIDKVAQAVQTVRRNGEECRQLAQLTDMIAVELRRLQESEMKDRLKAWKPLEGLKETLLRAYVLVASCQHGFSSYVLRFCFCCDLADQLRAVQKEMDLYLRILQLFIQGITYDDHTRLLKQIMDLLVEQVGAQVSAESSTNHSNRDAKTAHKYLQSRLPVIQTVTPGLRRFTFPQLENATNKFSPENQIGIGGSSIVYKGRLPDGCEVAIKRLAFTDEQSSFQFENEIELIPKLRHTNIVKILGYCIIRKREGILVFEYMPKGSLDCCIYGTSSTGMAMDWSARSRVVKGIAQGALYLTELCGLRIIHGDLKPGNILLDSDMNPKICDFGISKTLEPDSDEGYTHAVMGSPGFAAPEYYEEGRFSFKSDVYSFGATLLQIISGKRAPPSTVTLTGESRGCGPLNAWAWDLWKERRLTEFIDPSLHDEPPTRTAEMTRWVQIALLCVQQHPQERPSMGDVLLMLSCECLILQEPRQPGYQLITAEREVASQLPIQEK